MNGVDAFDSTGRAVAGVGDLNADGRDDIVVCAPSAKNGSLSRVGENYVVYGRDTQSGTPFPAVIELADLDGSGGFTIVGAQAGDRAGEAVAGAGDVNGDGAGDLILGAPDAGTDGVSRTGASFVVYGKTGGQSFPSLFSLASLDGANGFRISGADMTDESGTSVAGAGDVNGDGVGHLIIGAIGGDPLGRNGAGEAYVLFGRNLPCPSDIDGDGDGDIDDIDAFVAAFIADDPAADLDDDGDTDIDDIDAFVTAFIAGC